MLLAASGVDDVRVGAHNQDWRFTAYSVGFVLVCLAVVAGRRGLIVAIMACAGPTLLSVALGMHPVILFSFLVAALPVGLSVERRLVGALCGAYAVFVLTGIVTGHPLVTEMWWILALPFPILLWVGYRAGMAMRSADAARAALDRARAEEEERRHEKRRLLADDLHRSVNHYLTGAILHANCILSERPQDSDAQGIAQHCRLAQADLRTFIDTLAAPDTLSVDAASVPSMPPDEQALPRPSTIDIPTVIHACVGRLTALGHHVTYDCEVGVLPRERGDVVARVLEEGVANILTHAGRASRCTIDIRTSTPGEPDHAPGAPRPGQLVHVTVTNTLPGPDEERTVRHAGGLGIRSVQRHIDRVGGTLHSASAGGQWVLRADIPVSES
ncbi:MAG: hypothetical protein Q4G43_03245 [Mobilicoccus sp.]|nr:hypothetical protein [Mobilicoccus sp.]